MSAIPRFIPDYQTGNQQGPQGPYGGFGQGPQGQFGGAQGGGPQFGPQQGQSEGVQGSYGPQSPLPQGGMQPPYFQGQAPSGFNDSSSIFGGGFGVQGGLQGVQGGTQLPAPQFGNQFGGEYGKSAFGDTDLQYTSNPLGLNPQQQELFEAGVPVDVIQQGDNAVYNFFVDNGIIVDGQVVEDDTDATQGYDSNPNGYNPQQQALLEAGIPSNVIQQGDDAIRLYAMQNNIELEAPSAQTV